MNSSDLRQKFLKFFEDRGHKIIPSASLVPSESVELTGTKRVLFTTAGMHPLVPYLLGESHPEGKRLVNVQKCLRTDDIDQVGDSVHNTFFEMLGNWSLGGYWREEAISWSYQFLIDVLKLDAKRIYVSVFAGDADAPFDQESYDIWRKLGLPENHIFKYGKQENWWGPVGPTGPCGPDTEMFYDVSPNDSGQVEKTSDSNRFIEIWNDVFMQYDKQNDGSFKPLKQKNVDTGMGLERMLAVLGNALSIYETDVFLPLAKRIEDLASYLDVKSTRIVADHIRSSVFLISDGVFPSNVERGYVLRRLVRRAIRHASLLKIEEDFLEDLAKIVIKTYGDLYPNLYESQNLIIETLKKEEDKFKKALSSGIRQFEKTKGGLTVQTEKAAKLHTATHLLHQALRDVLGKHVHQTGSHITEERLRFDFSHHAKTTPEQIKQTEAIVNQKIRDNLMVNQRVMPKEEANKIGAVGLFEEKYGDLVNIYFIGPSTKIEEAYSKEFCGGPHTKSTGVLGHFKITKEESAGSDLRRIYATIEE